MTKPQVTIKPGTCPICDALLNLDITHRLITWHTTHVDGRSIAATLAPRHPCTPPTRRVYCDNEHDVTDRVTICEERLTP